MKKRTAIKLCVFLTFLIAWGCSHTPEEARLKAEERTWKESLKAKEKAERKRKKGKKRG